MDDLEFARRVSARIAELYSEAKRSQHHFPRHALIQTRALASLCCDMLYQAGGRESPLGLDEKIRALVKARLINPDTRALLHDLRRWGNAAAHPEDSLLDEGRFATLARQALAGSIALLETVFRQQHGGAEVPGYAVADDGRKDELKEVCYRALLENSAADQYQVAMLLRQQWVTSVEESGAGPNPVLASFARRFEFGALEGRALDLLRYASDANYPPACYQYGLALSEGRRGEQFTALGVSLIALASRHGDIDALAWCGRSALYGLHGEPVDFALAREHLERAAAEDHPLALTLLSTMYRDGLGMPADPTAAFGLTLRAAEAGYPIGQYQAGIALYRGDGVASDEPAALAYLKRASDAGLPEARHIVGNLIRRGALPGDVGEAEQLLASAMLRVNEAYLDLAELYMSQPQPRQWIEASRLVQAVYEKALRDHDGPIADRAFQAGPPLIARLEAAHGVMSDEERRDFVAARFMFDAEGRPFPDRDERLRVFVASTMALAQVRESGSGHEAPPRGKAGWMAGTPAIRHPAPQAPLAPVVQRVTHAKVGRNDPCPCGSGQKFKACCG
ncbi:SEC-C metal-binding domain-containing protein [Pseudoduganella sp. SL102]|uniref:SEC-C metal-binding domain-containing protein n=1 Tax=Pseudoduganella sp. SL102 TaxID=2995154 RepID=UPI00248BA32D|nr:SEC-C metal-binding domain-containing protein [Pseudoduganella sp. SL102]WBS04017.1 SEC-C metal-binding domain-containing protein [Pseudoduganella sp. SL102]